MGYPTDRGHANLRSWNPLAKSVQYHPIQWNLALTCYYCSNGVMGNVGFFIEFAGELPLTSCGLNLAMSSVLFNAIVCEDKLRNRRMAQVSIITIWLTRRVASNTPHFPASFQAFCYEMKVIQAFSWTIFILLVLAFYVLLQLVQQAERFGRYKIWSEPIRGESYRYPLEPS
jgi:hypothetical protein